MAGEPTMIILYEPASQSQKPWNPACLRARYSLDFKGIPYRSIRLEYPDIEPTLRSIGAAPTGTKPNGKPHYTVPVIVDPSHRTPEGGMTIVSDSWVIAEYLDDTYPSEEKLFPEGTKALQKLFCDHWTHTVLRPSSPLTVTLVHPFLNQASQPYWRATKEPLFKKKLEEICPKDSEKWEETWGVLQKGCSNLAILLDRNGEAGPFVMGNTVSFSDFFMVSTLDTVSAIIPGEWDKRIRHWDNGRWEMLRDHCAVWRKDWL